jgi:hypothetical protein
MTTRIRTLALVALLLSSAVPSLAKVKLTLMPQRENVRAHFEAGGAALMEEERVVALEEGVNQVELAWEGIAILPQSILFDPVGEQEKPTTLAVSTPPSGQSALLWWVKTAKAGNYRLRITYAVAGGGVTVERVDYGARANLDETSLDLSGRVRLYNGSGMVQNDVAVEIATSKPTQVSLDRDERRELLVLDNVTYPITKRFTSDPAVEGGRVQLLYEWKVPEAAAAQLAGKARAFLATAGGAGQLDTFLGESQLGYVPRGEDAKLFIGFANNVEVERKLIEARDDNVRFTKVPENSGRVPEPVLWDTKRVYTTKLKNHTDREITLRLVEHVLGQWEVASELKPTEVKSGSLIYFDIPLGAGAETEVTYTLIQRNVEPGEATF